MQYVLRPNLDFRGYAGQLASGVFRQGDLVLALPGPAPFAHRTHRHLRWRPGGGHMRRKSVTICLEDEIDISRGDMIVPALDAPHVAGVSVPASSG